jgi:hypothetical protein
VAFTVRLLRIVPNIITTLRSSTRFVFLTKHRSREFRSGKFQVKDITRKFCRIFKGKMLILTKLFRIIAKGAGGGLGSGAVSSSRGAIVSSVIELHKDEEIYILVGQQGEHACIKSMGLQDESCAPLNTKQSQGPKVHMVKDIYIDNGAGGGGGGSFVFLVRY